MRAWLFPWRQGMVKITRDRESRREELTRIKSEITDANQRLSALGVEVALAQEGKKRRKK